MAFFRDQLPTFLFRFIKETGTIPCMGVELEFYLEPEDHHNGPFTSFPNKEVLIACCHERAIPLQRIDTESGLGQFEAVFVPSADIYTLAEKIVEFKTLAADFLRDHGAMILFDPKPAGKEIGSGLHVHVSLHDLESQKNLFHKSSKTGDETPMMLSAIAGLLATMKEAMLLFCPTPQGLMRFSPHVSIPARFCWGGNNRTVALRLPDSTAFPEQRRIEHRVSSADANPHAVFIAILAGIRHGLTQSLVPGPKVHGNAFLAAYGESPYFYPLFPTLFEDVVRSHQESVILVQYGLVQSNVLHAEGAVV